MKCEKCKSENVIPSMSIPTFKCMDCGHVTRDYEWAKENDYEFIE